MGPDWDYEAQLRFALWEATEIIEKLAEQQAMPDDWYKADLQRLKELSI